MGAAAQSLAIKYRRAESTGRQCLPVAGIEAAKSRGTRVGNLCWHGDCQTPSPKGAAMLRFVGIRFQIALVILLFMGSLAVLLYSTLTTLALPRRELEARSHLQAASRE